MTRKLTLAATFACAALYICAVAAPTFAADVVAAGDKAVVLPWGDLIVAFGNEVSAILIPILVAAILWALRTYVPVAGMFVSQNIVQKLVQNSIDYATNAVSGAVKGQQLTIPVGSAVIAQAAQRAVDVAPSWLLKQAGGASGIAEKVFRTLHLEDNATAANVLAPALQAIQAAK